MERQESSSLSPPGGDLRERENVVLTRLLRWAEAREDVRAMLLYSSRANPGASLDEFSDYDVLLAVSDVPAFYADDRWLNDFGPVLTVFRNPLGEREGFPSSLFVTHYEDGVKADFAFIARDYFRHLARQPRLPDDLDYGYRVLLDKDGLTASLPAPTFTAYRLTPPTESVYHALIGEFFNDALYVAKSLRRGDLLPAKLSLDHVMKYECLRQMLDWRFGVETHWSKPSRACGKGLRQRVHPALWAELERTYVGAGIEDNWEALFSTITLFCHVAREVAQELGLTYPHDHERRVLVYLNRVREGNFP